ncbi:response regulator [Rariglobus hedericola]|uniref:Response regulator transcription factor n=1 Tax=Rariglobus hedericola TaxID=2597822 RepID=A0A556QEE9_9BACT|nr:response regulator transcription factor [Rariglobus hedericola]TSJ75033.1 response regulator transcription factor [Rariglobus hedericola]
MRRVLIVEDVCETRVWLRELVLAAFPESSVDEAGTLRRGLELCAKNAYDLAVVDLGLPDGSGLGVLRMLRATHAATLSVVTTVMGDDAHIVTALSAGAQGYLLKDQPREMLIRQLQQVREGIPALSPPVARRIMDHFKLTGPCEEPDAKLTTRELEVLGLIARGLRIADAACALGLAEGTVASHIKAIYRKLGINSRAEAALHANRMGLLGAEGRT